MINLTKLIKFQTPLDIVFSRYNEKAIDCIPTLEAYRGARGLGGFDAAPRCVKRGAS